MEYRFGRRFVLGLISALSFLAMLGTYIPNYNAYTASSVSTTTTTAAGLYITPTTGASGTVVSVTVNGCRGPNVTFTDGTLSNVIPLNGPQESQNPSNLNVSDTGTYTVPLYAQAGTASISASCTNAVPNAVYQQSFTVDSTSSTSSSTSSTSSSSVSSAAVTTSGARNPPIVGIAAGPNNAGYWLVAADGGVFTFGNIPFYGSMGGKYLNAPIVGIASTPDHKGYWLVGADGGVFAFGDAGFYGSMAGQHLNAPISGIAPTPNGGGYWLVGQDGGLFTFGNAGYTGNCYSIGGCGTPIVGISTDAAAPNNGYWLIGQNGGIFSFGAPFYGSMGGKSLNAPMVAMTSTNNGGGYWETGTDGGIFTFGNAPFEGSMSGKSLNAPISGIAPTSTNTGYWLVGQDGGVYTFGNAPFYGSMVSPSSQPPPPSGAVSSPPPVTTSEYVSTTSAQTMSSQGCTEAHNDSSAQNGRTSIVVLDFGGQTSTGTLLINGTAVTDANIVAGTESYISGFKSCIGSSTDQLTVAIGTNNSITETYTTGQDWAQNVVGPVATWITSQHYSGVSAAGANDLETSYSSPAAAQSWAQGYVGNNPTNSPYYDYGSANGCPQQPTTSGTACNNGWTVGNEYYVAGGVNHSLAKPLPEIYATTGANAQQWQGISSVGTGMGGALVFAGEMTQYTACQTQPCPGANNTPTQGWNQLYNALNGSSNTAQASLPWSTDI